MNKPLLSFLLNRANSYIKRWHNRPIVGQETLAEHHFHTARIAYWIAYLASNREDLDASKVAMRALFHDELEAITGDIPAYVKHHIPNAKEQITGWEEYALTVLSSQTPPDLQYRFARLVNPGDTMDESETQIVKYADILSAYSFLNDQITAGNRNQHILSIFESLKKQLTELDWPWLNRLRAEYDLP